MKRTPSAYLGSCRFKLPEICDDREIYDEDILHPDKLEVEYFFYITRHDSMDTIKKTSDYSPLNGSKIRFMGVPKTIDNDLAATDHTPDTAARPSISALITKEVIRDGLLYMTSRTGDHPGDYGPNGGLADRGCCPWQRERTARDRTCCFFPEVTLTWIPL